MRTKSIKGFGSLIYIIFNLGLIMEIKNAVTVTQDIIIINKRIYLSKYNLIDILSFVVLLLRQL